MATRALKTVEQVLDEKDGETLHQAMALAFAEIEAATKSAANDAFKRNGKASKYADLGAVIDAIKPALIRHGLFFTQHPQPSSGGVTVETLLHHRNGESVALGSLFVPANKQDAHGFGSALTYCRRYSLMTAFGVPAEDDDGNAAVSTMSEPKEETIMASPADVKLIKTLAPKADRTIQQICEGYNVSELSELTAEKAAAAIKRLQQLTKEPA